MCGAGIQIDIDQWKQTENPEIDPHIHCLLIFFLTEPLRQPCKERKVFPTNDATPTG